MTCLVNAPNLDMEWEESGMAAVPPDSVRSSWSEIRIEEIGKEG